MELCRRILLSGPADQTGPSTDAVSADVSYLLSGNTLSFTPPELSDNPGVFTWRCTTDIPLKVLPAGANLQSPLGSGIGPMATEQAPQRITLTLSDDPNAPILTVESGTVLPGTIAVLDRSGTQIGVYTIELTPPMTSRIVGGEESPAGALPFMIDVKAGVRQLRAR